MNNKVEQLAKGIFDYEIPSILLSEEELIIQIDVETDYTGSFTIKNTKNSPITGILFSSSELLTLEHSNFSGVENIISYYFHGKSLIPGEAIKGDINIISDCGETRLPFYVNIEPPYLNSTIGTIKDLFNFTNLAKTDQAEAVKLFKSKAFRDVIKYHDGKYLILYDNLLKSRTVSQALEEFLVTIRKKTKVNFIVDKNILHYEINGEDFMDKVTLMKDNWGYEEIRVSTDAPFLNLEHKIIWSDYFVGNTYPVEFVVKTKKMRPGNNFGRIYFVSAHDTTTVEVTCHYNTKNHRKSKNHKNIKENQIQIVNKYLEFRSHLCSLDEYISKSTLTVEKLMDTDIKNRDLYELMSIHLFLINGQEDRAKVLLEDIKNKKNDNCPNWYLCGYEYLNAIYQKNEESTQSALAVMKEKYKKDSSDWRILWFLLHLDKRYENNRALKFTDIKNAFLLGCKSPILYFEAITAFNEEPVLLNHLGNFELQVLYFATNHDYASEDVALQITYLASKIKSFNRLVFFCLTNLYRIYPRKDILSAICSLLIKGNKKSSKYFSWYQAGVKEQLRITELYEYFMYSLDEETEEELPQSVLLYFIYNSNLSDKKKAYLYAYIIKRKEKLKTLYHSYYKKMENFGLKLLKEHIISRDLSVLYEEIINQTGLTKEIATELPSIMFKHEIGVSAPGIKGISIIHKERTEESFSPLLNGSALVDIYTENYEVFLVDKFENRFTKTVDYTLNKLMHWEHYSKDCFTLGIVHPMLLFNLSEKVQSYQKFDSQSIEIRKQLLSIDNLGQEQRNIILMDLIGYYYDNFMGELLEFYLEQIDLHGLFKEDRIKIIELYINREYYDKALDAIVEFGTDGIRINRLIRLCTYLLQEKDEEEEQNTLLTNLCYSIFKAGKYNEEILNYLVANYGGTTSDMYSLWEAAVSFEMNTHALEERLLSQMLYTQGYIVNSMAVFLNYYKDGRNHKLVRAFLSFHAYKYLINDRMLNTEIFTIIKRELIYEENEICLLALLKYYSKEEYFSEEEKDYIDIHVNEFIQKGIVMPFFLRFKEIIPLSAKIRNHYFVEYNTNPVNKVKIHYRLEEEDCDSEYKEEEMKNIYLGIHVKDFVLFYNENIQYYITEEDEEGLNIITESLNVQLEPDIPLEEDTRYNQINFILTALEMQDDKTLIESIKNYSQTNYLMNDFCKPL